MVCSSVLLLLNLNIMKLLLLNMMKCRILMLVVGQVTVILGWALLVWLKCPELRHQDEGMVWGVEVGVADQPVLVSVHGDEAAPGLAPLHLVLHDAVQQLGAALS